MPVNDFTSDSGLQLLHKIALQFTVPEYVKSCSPESLHRNEASVSKCAMITPEPRFPCANRASTWYSYAAFTLQKESADLPAEELNKAANYLRDQADWFGITADIDLIDAEYSATQKTAEATDEAYPVRGVVEAKAASQFLEAQLESTAPSIPLQERISLARKVSAYGFSSDSIKRATCHYGCYDGPAVAKILRMSDNPQAIKLAEICEGYSPAEMQAAHKTAAEICEAIGVLGPCPEVKLAVNTTEPVAMLTNGAVVKSAVLASCNSDILTSAATGLVSIEGPDIKKIKVAGQLDEAMADRLVGELRSQGALVEVHPLNSPFEFSITAM